MIRSWTFQQKVRAGFVVMVSLQILTAGIAVYSLRTVVANTHLLISSHAQAQVYASDLQAAANREAAGFRGFVASTEAHFLEERNRGRVDFDGLIVQLQALDQSDDGRRLLKEIQDLQRTLISEEDRVIAQRSHGGDLEAALRAMKQDLIPQRDVIRRILDSFTALKQRALETASAQTADHARMASTLLISLAGAAVFFAMITALVLGRTLSQQVGTILQHVTTSSSELQTSANQQASGAKETATAMSEVTTTMSELLATSRQITESAQQVAQIADQTASAARSGDRTVIEAQDSIEGIRRQVNTIVGHMLELSKKSQSIGSVLDIITELAEQTNILSINATIEAAGAGEQGKRFSVVGDEIRKLADRVGGSVKDIRAMVDEIRGAVNTTVLATETGSKAVDAGLHKFEEVTRGFRNIADMVVTATQAAREIELSTKQQTSAVEQVTAAISGAAQVSRENEASSAQNLQTAAQLARLSNNLSQIVLSRAAV